MARSLQQLPCAGPGDGEDGARGTFWVFPGGFEAPGPGQTSGRGASSELCCSSQGGEGDDNAHFCLRHLKHCLRHHLQLSPYISAPDVKKLEFWMPPPERFHVLTWCSFLRNKSSLVFPFPVLCHMESPGEYPDNHRVPLGMWSFLNHI